MDGILPLWKEKGMTSHDCVFKVRKKLKMKKVGHTGTLDPNVEGVLPICLGKGTKLVELLMDKTKRYSGTITFGFATDTEDLDGQIIEENTIHPPFQAEEIDQKMRLLEGEIQQIPPMYSAVKVNGRRLYEYARAGESVERPVRKVRIDAFKRTSDVTFNEEAGPQSFHFEVICGKGTYIRTLATDLGKYLGIPATMTRLVREGSSPFEAKDCLTLDEIDDALEQGNLEDKVWSIETILGQYPIWEVPDTLVKLVQNGAVIEVSAIPENLCQNAPFVAKINGQLIALYDQHPSKKNKVKPLKMF